MNQDRTLRCDTESINGPGKILDFIKMKKNLPKIPFFKNPDATPITMWFSSRSSWSPIKMLIILALTFLFSPPYSSIQGKQKLKWGFLSSHNSPGTEALNPNYKPSVTETSLIASCILAVYPSPLNCKIPWK